MLNILVALCCSFLWAGVLIATKLLASSLPTLAFAFIRYALVVLCLLPFFIVNKEYRQVQLADILGIMLLGLLLVLVFNTLFFISLAYAPATSVAIIGATNPLFMMLVAALLLSYNPDRSQLVAFLLAFVGATLVITHGQMGFSVFTGSIGELLTMVAVACQTAYAFMLRKVNTRYSTLFVAFVTALSGILFVFPFIANKKFFDVLLELTPYQWGLFAFISFLGSTLAIFLYAFAMKSLGPARISLIVFSTMPVFVMLLGYPLLGETISIWQLVGGILVIIALFLGLRQT